MEQDTQTYLHHLLREGKTNSVKDEEEGTGKVDVTPYTAMCKPFTANLSRFLSISSYLGYHI